MIKKPDQSTTDCPDRQFTALLDRLENAGATFGLIPNEGLREPSLAMGILQACRFVGLGKTKMQELINRGDVATAKVDGRTLVLTDSVVALIERHRVARGQ